jgi:hypothetical protein
MNCKYKWKDKDEWLKSYDSNDFRSGKFSLEEIWKAAREEELIEDDKKTFRVNIGDLLEDILVEDYLTNREAHRSLGEKFWKCKKSKKDQTPYIPTLETYQIYDKHILIFNIPIPNNMPTTVADKYCKDLYDKLVSELVSFFGHNKYYVIVMPRRNM